MPHFPSFQKISDTEGGFEGTLGAASKFGQSVASLGDFDGDNITDLIVGSHTLDSVGAVWLLFMNSNDTVKSFQKITSGEGGFRTGTLSSNCHFGSSVALLGDLNNDGVPDLAVGAQQDPGRRSGGDRVGAMWVLFMNADGTVKTDMMITSAGEEFSGSLGDRNYFGTSVAPLGDLNGDNRVDMAVGARGDGSGAVWILFMDSGGTVGSHQKIADGGAGFSGTLGSRDVFGSSLAALGDFNNDNVIDLVVGAAGNDDGGLDRGAVWLLFLNSDGTVDSNQKISYTVGGLGVPLTN